MPADASAKMGFASGSQSGYGTSLALEDEPTERR